jgi:hypothetical protein
MLLASLQAEQEASHASPGDTAANGTSSTTAAPWFKDIPTALTGAFAPVVDAPSLLAAIVKLLKKHFSNLILMPFDQIDEHRSIKEFGVDSMIASEFRTWFWTIFCVEIPFLDIMSAHKSLAA